MHTDRTALSNGITVLNTGDSSTLMQAGQQLQRDIQTFGSYPPIPNAQAEQHWQALLTDLTALANGAAGYDGSLSVVTQMDTGLNQANAEQQAILAITGWS